MEGEVVNNIGDDMRKKGWKGRQPSIIPPAGARDYGQYLQCKPNV